MELEIKRNAYRQKLQKITDCMDIISDIQQNDDVIQPEYNGAIEYLYNIQCFYEHMLKELGEYLGEE